MTELADYHQLKSLSTPVGEVFVKQGVRGFPELPPAAAELSAWAGGAESPVVDASSTAGAVALAAAMGMGDSSGEQEVIESSRAALACARRTLAGRASRVSGGLPWDISPASVQRLFLAPPGDRGSTRVAAELRAAARALAPEGVAYIALHKEQGAKRYGKFAAGYFGETEIISRNKGWRVLKVGGGSQAEAGEADQFENGLWLRFEAAGLQVSSLPGVYAAGRLDPGTAVLVDELPWAQMDSRRVLDLGCGSGVLSILAGRAGASVTAVDDDLAAVRSTARNAADHSLEVESLHSDIDSELIGRRFDTIITNPPFHVGRGVRLAVPAAFIAAARRLLLPGGELWLVANRDLPYERLFEGWHSCRLITDRSGFKVLNARC